MREHVVGLHQSHHEKLPGVTCRGWWISVFFICIWLLSFTFLYWMMFVCLWKWTLVQFLCWKESVVNLFESLKRVCFFRPSFLFSWHDHQAVGLPRIWVHQDNVWWVVHRLCLHSTCENVSTSEERRFFSSPSCCFFLFLPPPSTSPCCLIFLFFLWHRKHTNTCFFLQ